MQKKFPIVNTEGTFTITSDIQSIENIWKLDGVDLETLSPEILLALQNAPPFGMEFRYLVLQEHSRSIALFYYQILPFRASDSLKYDEESISDKNFVSAIYHRLRTFVASKIEFTTLILGNLLMTGTHGFKFLEEVSLLDQQKWISKITDCLFGNSELISDASILLIKDFNERDRLDFLRTKDTKNIYEFLIQPGMRFTVDSDWHSMSEYMQALESKYRVKFNKARKNISSLSLRSLDLEEIEKYREELYSLYQNVALTVGFNMVHLNKNYLIQLKTQLGEKFQIFAYFDNGNPVAYYSFIINGKEMLAHSLGLEKTYNAKHKIYLNILLNFIEQAIDHQMYTIDFARTALEIKSSVGAVEEKLYCYVTHRSKWKNYIIPKIIDFLNTPETWQARSPFKNEEVQL